MKPVYLSAGQYYGDLTKRSELDFAHLSVTGYAGGEIIRKHYHENSYLSLLIRGTYTEESRHNTKVISNGDIIFRPTAYDHANKFSSDPGLCFNIEFKSNWSEVLDLKLDLPADNAHYKSSTFPGIHKAFMNFMTGKETEHILEDVLHWLLEVNGVKLPESNIPWINKVKNILDTETQIHHSIQSVSERVFVHPVYLAGCFKKKTGVTIGQYQTAAKLNKAARQLFGSRQSITEVAIEHGFFDAAHFIRQFKSEYGITPLKFRKTINS